MTVVDIPRASVDLAPGLPSRIVYGTVLIPTEDRGPAGAWIEVSIPGEIKVSGDETTLTGRTARIPLNEDGSFAVRLPTTSEGIEPENWALSVRMSWRPVAFPMLVPAGVDPIWIEDCLFPELVPGEDPSKYFLTGVQVRSVTTLAPGESAFMRADVTSGVMSVDLGIPQGPRGLPGPGAVATDEAVATLLSTRQSDTQGAADGRYLGQGTLAVSTDTYGTTADGVTDDTAALQAALDSGARFVYVPTGVYRISAPLRVPASTVFYTFSATLVSDAPGLEAFITAWGSYTTAKKFELAAPADAGARVLETKLPHTYQPGDVLRLVSQRVSTNPDDAGDDQLGWATGTGQTGTGPYFAEFVRVQAVTDTTVTLDNGILFNGYRHNADQETDPAAGPSAYLADFNGRGDNVIISGFEFEGEADYGVRVTRARNVRVRDIRWTREQPGRFIQFQDCYYADGERCYIETRQWEESDEGVDHAAINQYHVVGSWRSGFTHCRSVRGTQPYDFTYSGSIPHPSVWCYVRESTAEGVLHNPVTAHPGTYGIIVASNIFTDCQHSGISIRSNAAEVTHNIVRGSNRADRVGLYVFEGGGKESRIESNTVAGFDIAMRLNDGGSKPFRDRIDTVFRANTMRDFRIGWMRTRTTGQPVPAEPQGVSLIGNRFESDHPDAVAVITCEGARGINGLVIDSNEFILRGSLSQTTGVLVTANSRGVVITGNVFHQVGDPLTYDPAGHSGATPDTVTWGGNTLLRASSLILPACTSTFKLSSADQEIWTVRGTPDLAHYTTPGKWRTGSNSDITTAGGFPVSGTAVFWEVDVLSASRHVQTVHAIAGGQRRIYRRDVQGGSPSEWQSISFT